MNKKILIALLSLLAVKNSVIAQVSNKVEMAEEMRKSGKIYVVVAVVVIIFLGIIAYLVKIERKLNKLEKQNKF